jgi:hypothetical protein
LRDDLCAARDGLRIVVKDTVQVEEEGGGTLAPALVLAASAGVKSEGRVVTVMSLPPVNSARHDTTVTAKRQPVTTTGSPQTPRVQ